jgi:phosphotransferase system enzyme I (PtsI)
VSLELNIELPDEIARMSRFAADGVGLFRTEFLFLARSDWPEENEQYEVYARLAEAFVGRPVTIRTMDVGGDKLARRLRVEPENNPFLGWRAIRISLAQPEVFRTQIRAVLRASAHGDIRLMFPLVTSVEELRQAREHVDQAKTELDERNEAYNPNMPVGIMVETPASVMIADELAQDADFFSIGTNDLVQYTLAVDRNNEHVAALFDTSHPAILRLINRTVIAGHRAGIKVFICGEMAHEPVAAMLLVGLGIDGLSMAPGGIPELKQLIRQFSLADAQQVAREALEQTTGEDVRNLVRHAFSERGILTP